MTHQLIVHTLMVNECWVPRGSAVCFWFACLHAPEREGMCGFKNIEKSPEVEMNSKKTSENLKLKEYLINTDIEDRCRFTGRCRMCS